jgi:hypothetical protein
MEASLHLATVLQLVWWKELFAKLRNTTITFVMSVSLPIRTEQLCSHWTDFNYIWYLSIFRNSVEKIQVSLNSDKNDCYRVWRPIYMYDQEREILLISDSSSSLWRWIWQRVPKRRQNLIRRRGNTQKKTYNEKCFSHSCRENQSSRSKINNFFFLENLFVCDVIGKTL